MNITNFFLNPVSEAFSIYVGVMGVWFYAGVFTVIGIYILMKTESWAAASAAFILGALLFSALLPAYLIFLWAIAAALSFAFLLVDIFILK